MQLIFPFSLFLTCATLFIGSFQQSSNGNRQDIERILSLKRIFSTSNVAIQFLVCFEPLKIVSRVKSLLIQF